MSKQDFLRGVRLGVLLAVLSAAAFAAYKYFPGIFPTERPVPQTADPELNKLNLIIEYFKNADLEVITDGVYRKPSETLPWVRRYVSQHFKPGDNAADWIRQYCYQTNAGNMIYVRFPDGSTRLLRDYFLEHLALMEAGDRKALA
ncbi:MAG TPA: hypothetical protein VL688_01005 [Verrucomicrobiae bacterium]|jgi:hypothetical protein|nr:hypothetical protein [Verrucomicrobiae bacterium]